MDDAAAMARPIGIADFDGPRLKAVERLLIALLARQSRETLEALHDEASEPLQFAGEVSAAGRLGPELEQAATCLLLARAMRQAGLLDPGVGDLGS